MPRRNYGRAHGCGSLALATRETSDFSDSARCAHTPKGRCRRYHPIRYRSPSNAAHGLSAQETSSAKSRKRREADHRASRRRLTALTMALRELDDTAEMDLVGGDHHVNFLATTDGGVYDNMADQWPIDLSDRIAGCATSRTSCRDQIAGPCSPGDTVIGQPERSRTRRSEVRRASQPMRHRDRLGGSHPSATAVLRRRPLCALAAMIGSRRVFSSACP